MRRRTKTIGIGKGRVVIYIAVIAAIWLTDYVYTNYVEPKRQQIEERLEQRYASHTSDNQASESSTEAKAQGKTLRAGWAELPAISKQKQLYTTLHLCDDGLRNYTACFSSEHCCPVWVAAPLHRSYKGDTKRSDSFTFDPTIPAKYQPQINRSYGDYTRGHLLGSAERTASLEMNEQTFYATNIAPQLRDGFNSRGGAWNNIERMVDKQICNDTLYVVTGCLFDDYTHTDGREVKASTTTNRSDGKRIGVPTAYYKAMLRTKRGSTGKSVAECNAEELKCAAIIVPHSSAAGYKPSKQDLISIKELERLSGLEFFANVKNAPKGKASASDWGL
ncbi:MAG: DNA/RNA non-specific endonuclease [Alistipes sp.]|nr:DNA/RNA non-specific endonuclease [Alistipes sp.]